MDRCHQSVLFSVTLLVLCLLTVVKSNPAWCDPHFGYNSPDVANQSVTAYCRYYGDRFYECTAWNRLVARNHWIATDGIIPQQLWINQNQHVRIAECKFYDNYQYRCRQTPVCIGTVCERKTCPWGGAFEGTPHAGFKARSTNVVVHAETPHAPVPFS